MRDEAQRPRNEGRGAQAHAPPPLQSRGEGDGRSRRDLQDGETKEKVCEGTRNGMKKTGEAAQAASPQKGTMTAHRGAHVTA